jgi:hypothetical protein
VSRKQAKRIPQRDVATENFEAGCALVSATPLLAPLWAHTNIVRKPGNRCPADGWAVVTNDGAIHAHPTRRGTPQEWAYVLAHCLLHLGFGHFDTRLLSPEWNDACDWFLAGFQRQLKVGRAPDDMATLAQAPAATEEKIYQYLRESAAPPDWHGCGAAGQSGDMATEPEPNHGWYRKPAWQEYFAEGLARAVSRAVLVAAGEDPDTSAANPRSAAERARRWFMSSYPLLGALAASFKLIEDPGVCYRMGIGVAAVDTQSREIFFNPGAGLSDEEYKFVMAHELLHVGLRHDVRRSGRDPFFWNIACFPAGTWTGNGQSIEEIAAMRRNYSGELIYIDAQNGQIASTPEHPFYVRKRKGISYPIKLGEPAWVEAQEIRSGDYLLVPRFRDKVDDTSIDLSAFIQEGSDTLGRRTFGNRAVKSIPLDEDTAWLIGLYVAEGSASPNVRFSLSAKETDISERIVGILHRIGYSASISVTENSMNVLAGTTVLGRWLKAHCGQNAHSKHIPRVILKHANPQIRQAFLAGLVAGDGHVRQQTASSTTVAMIGSVSERLICDVALLLAQDGIGGSRGILRRGPRQIGKTMTQQELALHIFRWNADSIAKTERIFNGRILTSHGVRWRADEHGVWYPVRATRSQPFEGEVYNMTTADHTYIANTFLVHNCDYVINAWLIEMRIGVMPKIGALHDPELKGESAESIYDRIVTDMRRFRRIATMRGVGVSDIIERNGPEWWTVGEGLTLDDVYRSALGQGLGYHEVQGRGYLPAGLVEEIRALAQPPIPWDVELARWFDNYFPPLERVRSYARPSRHQSATPDIPRPRWVPPPDWEDGRTFGVILDTSGSMDRTLLAKALGAIASYAASRDVPAVRVVFCDAATYDQGYMRPEDIAGEVKVRGRGGTVLQSGVDLLERAEDFPKEGPILIITDGYCDKLEVKPAREHAFLLPEGHSLPFAPRGKMFYVR